MPLDCDELRACADLLHDEAAERMVWAQRDGRHQPAYVDRMRTVAAIEEVALAVEAKVAEDC